MGAIVFVVPLSIGAALTLYDAAVTPVRNG